MGLAILFCSILSVPVFVPSPCEFIADAVGFHCFFFFSDSNTFYMGVCDRHE